MNSVTRSGGLAGIARTISFAALWVACAMILAVILVLNHMIVIRLLGEPVVWHLELSIYLTIGAFFLGTPYAVLSRGDVAIDLLNAVLSPRKAGSLRIAVLLVMLTTAAYLVWSGLGRTLEAMHSNLRSTSLWGPPLWPVYATMPLGLALACLQMLAELSDSIARLRQEKTP
ncbi:MAG: TRAP transporter small permease [Rhodospirillales bacterium]